MISDAPVIFLVKLSEDDKNCISLAGPAGMYRGSILWTEVVLNSLASITFSILWIIFVYFCSICNATQMCRASRIHAFRNFCGSWRFLECDAIKSRLLFLSSHWPSPPAWHKSFDADNSRTEHQTFYLLKTARGAVSKNAKAEVMGYCHTSYGKKVIFTYS